MNYKQLLEELDDGLKKAERHVDAEFATVHSGKASSSMVDSVFVDAYGTKSRIRDIGAITTPDARTISIQPWDKGLSRAIEKAILLANIGLTPVVDADRVRCLVPEMSRERRLELVKRAHTMAESGRVQARTARRELMDRVKALQKAGALPEDDAKRCEKDIQKRTDDAIGAINAALAKKEKELMTV
ncbi:MAG: ribosome recycling factor [Puniceicoccales bacterium]|jgi:ribosome recycling factor|nr:ribosome recycling factor [Puniceicoccales bacterium]